MIRRAGTGHRLWTALCILILGIACSRGSEPYRPVPGDPLLEPWRWSTFPELSGLSAQCMTEGKDGKMWFGTVSGIWNYDGIEWQHFGFEQIANDNDVVSLSPTADGSLYVGARGGISQYRNGTWTRLFYAGGSRFGDIRKLVVGSDGALWAATSWGALHFQNSRWTLHTTREIADRMGTNQGANVVSVELLPETVTTKGRTNSLPARRHDISEVCVDPKGRIWLGTDGGEILCHHPAASRDSTNAPAAGREVEWTLYNERDGIVCGRAPGILPLRDGQVWVVYGTGSGHLNVFDGVRWQATRLLDAGVSEDCSNPLQTHDGAVWLSGRYVIHALHDGHWRDYQKPGVPVPTARNFLFQSADGALWMAGSGTEIQRVDYQTPRWLTLQDLNFQWESPEGTQWFLHRSGRIVTHQAGRWISYGDEDGVIDAPVALVGTRNGEVWAAGSHGQTAATARFDGRKWTRFVHDELSWGIDWRGVLAASDGSVWFSANVDSSGPKQHRNGILQFRNGEWIHHHQPGRAPRNGDDTNPATLLPATQRPEPVGKLLCLGESADGRIWAGRNILVFQDGRRWNTHAFPPELRMPIMETLFTSHDRELWIGTRQYGALRYDGREWKQFQGKDTLAANSVRSLAQSSDGSVWAATDRGVSRFDGLTWSADVLPPQLNVPVEGGSLKASASGALWINRFAPEWNRRAWPKAGRLDTTNCEFWTVCHQFKGMPPETTITTGTKTVAQPGNVSVFWTGMAPWREPKDSHLQFSYRLDAQPWSPFTPESGHAFFTLPSGHHHLEVRARDRDYNVDPTPATLDFEVLPQVWRQGWFIAMILILAGAILVQSLRVIWDRSLLRKANRKLAAEVEERVRAEQTVLTLNEELALRVSERTRDLQKATDQLRSNEAALLNLVRDLNEKTAALGAKNEELVRMNNLFVNRELRMVELKKRIQELETNTDRSAADHAGDEAGTGGHS
jgi:ligand-binding sensor domain-containing protein